MGQPGVPLALLGLGLCWAVAAERHTVFWNSSNPRFLWSDYTVEVRLNDYLDIICPHYEEGSVDPRAMERYTLYLVELEEYQACKPSSKEQIRWECDKPSALHGPEKFSEKFQRFTPFTLGKEFREGHSYYYISKPIHHHGEACLKLKVTVTGKGTPAPPAPASTQKGRIQADDAAAHVPGPTEAVATGDPRGPCSSGPGALPCAHLGDKRICQYYGAGRPKAIGAAGAFGLPWPFQDGPGSQRPRGSLELEGLKCPRLERGRGLAPLPRS